MPRGFGSSPGVGAFAGVQSGSGAKRMVEPIRRDFDEWTRAPAGGGAGAARARIYGREACSIARPVWFFGRRRGRHEPRTRRAGGFGRIQIVVDETRQRMVTGAAGDPQIQALLLNAARDPGDPGLREESLSLLNQRSSSKEVRDMLVYALKNDDNAGVRMRAIEGLKEFSAEPDVRGALSQALLGDANPGIRMRAIDLLAGDVGGNGVG